MTDLKDTPLSGAEIDTLIALVERGPLESGDIPAKSGRVDLIRRGYAAYIIVQGEFTSACAATYEGGDAYKRHFGSALQQPGEKLEDLSLSEVIAHRAALFDIHKAFHRPSQGAA